MTEISAKPKLAVWKFSSCDGCQLSLLSCEDELLTLVGQVDIAYFLEASRAEVEGPYDLSLVEGSITTEQDAERIHRVRRRVTSAGDDRRVRHRGRDPGAAQLHRRRGFRHGCVPLARVRLNARDSTPISAHVPVDFELQGCPVNKYQLLEVIRAALGDRRPAIPASSVCQECKLRGNVCVLVAHGTPCLGPVTHAGCGAVCPAFDRGCYGCYGPMESPNTRSLSTWLRKVDMDDVDLVRVYRTFNAGAPDVPTRK